MDVEKDTIKITEEAISDVLKALPVNGLWTPSFGWFQKTGEKEITLTMRIYRQSMDTKVLIEKVKLIVEKMGWIYKVADNVRDAGEVV